MGWRDWIEPREVSQLSQLSLSQTAKDENPQLSHCQKKVSLLDPSLLPDGQKKTLSGEAATVTVATPATGATITLVACRDCQHFKPDSINPEQGIGHCRIDAHGDRPPWPTAPRRCRKFEITRAGVFRLCWDAVAGTDVDPSELCQWLMAQQDAAWLTPTAVKRWAELVHSEGWPK